jgi:homoserine O-succinyltransferase/O-acetyltransferase
MLICMERDPSGTLGAGGEYQRGSSPVDVREAGAHCIDIGLVINMPDAALEATERQFRTLLEAAADGIAVRLTFYAMPDVPRAEWGRRHVSTRYSDVRELWDTHLHGLIVTGTEPRAPHLPDEPYWGSLTRLMEWAEHNTHSTIWSCLAAHAAVLHLDGVRRRPLGDKRFGVFECARVSEHQLTAGVPSRLRMPHSRWNDLPEDALTSCGYRVLTRSDAAGVDTFVKQGRSLFVFFQGHPEYEANSLLLEYRRDIKRFLRRERETYPPMPQGYFDGDAVAALLAVQERALSDRREERLADFPTALAEGSVANTWRPAATQLYRNWLLDLCARRDRGVRARSGRRQGTRQGAVYGHAR